MTFLGIDGGGSKTTFILEDRGGHELAHFETGSSNWLSAGAETARKSLYEGVARLPAIPDVVCGGFAGAGRPEGVDFYRSSLTTLLPKTRVLVETDAFIAYVGALGLQPGVLVIAGTGSIAMARKSYGTLVRVGGWGPAFSDEGGGFWIGREAIRAALHASDTQTMPDYVALVTGLLGLRAIGDIPAAWKSGAVEVRTVASLVPSLISLYPAEPAKRILADAANHLRSLAETARQRADLPASCTMSIVGSLGMQAVIRDLIGIDFQPPANPPARGAILWARDRISPA